MNGLEGLAAGRRAAVDGDVDQYFLDLSHRRATGEGASDVDRQFLVSTQCRENAKAEQRF